MSMKPLVGDKKAWLGRRGRIRLWNRHSWQARFSLAISRSFFYAALLIVVFTIACAIVPGWIAPYSPTEMLTDAILQAPSWAHLFGTDYFGRDIFSVVVYGSRDSLLIGFASVLVGGLAGSALGIISGYIGGIVDSIIMRAVDILMAVPGVLLALSVAAALGPGLLNIALAVAVASIPGYARVMRGQVMSVKGLPFITATRSLGGSNTRIFWRHVLPHSLSPLLVMATLGVGTSILTGSGLSFLGLGVLKEIPDWGALLSQGRGYLTVAWWICTFPGLAITLFVLAVNLIGDDIRDRLDPKVNGAA
ncbi:MULTISPECIES: ABC transporter permease [unclassified Paenibacillus]|uniref:ABC transporter permease n=1 Tax=unclassified Paenibacillus TaxID=185978 RepID=UPI000FE25CAD|nr:MULTISPECIES: ABC transporter permease [unclassified Paenibacillus]MCM3175104.1 ABC transporter permease [Paenibacillus sp. MER 99-2]